MNSASGSVLWWAQVISGRYEQLRLHNAGNLSAGRERNTTYLMSALYYRAAPQARLLLEGRYINFDDLSKASLDGYDIALSGSQRPRLVGPSSLGASKSSSIIMGGASRLI